MKHEGFHSKRLRPEAGNLLEAIYARRWAGENEIRTGRPTPLLAHLIGDFDERDAQVAATVVQWLGSIIGQSFVEEVALEYHLDRHEGRS